MPNLYQTCIKLCEITHDHALWMDFLSVQQRRLPLPPHLRRPPSSVDLPSTVLESAVTSTYRVAQSWMLPRQTHPIKLVPKLGDSLLGLQVFLDRWLLSIYSDGLVHLWDIGDKGRHTNLGGEAGALCGTLYLQSNKWTSFFASLDAQGTSVVLAMTYSSS